jgi:hypothetical protein
MRTEVVEIYSDTTNCAVLRHPGRRFPGVLVQGDTLYNLCRQADRICLTARNVMSADDYEEMDYFREELRTFLSHYKKVMSEHGLSLPFFDTPVD